MSLRKTIRVVAFWKRDESAQDACNTEVPPNPQTSPLDRGHVRPSLPPQPTDSQAQLSKDSARKDCKSAANGCDSPYMTSNDKSTLIRTAGGPELKPSLVLTSSSLVRTASYRHQNVPWRFNNNLSYTCKA